MSLLHRATHERQWVDNNKRVGGKVIVILRGCLRRTPRYTVSDDVSSSAISRDPDSP